MLNTATTTLLDPCHPDVRDGWTRLRAEGDGIRVTEGAVQVQHSRYVRVGGDFFQAGRTYVPVRLSTGTTNVVGDMSLPHRREIVDASTPTGASYIEFRKILSDATGPSALVESDADEAVSATQVRSPVVALVMSALSRWKTSPREADEVCTAEAARDDARTLLDRHRLPGGATVEVNDDGILSIEWEREGRGVLLVFSGDGTAGYSSRDERGFYSSGVVEFVIGAGLPRYAGLAIEKLTD